MVRDHDPHVLVMAKAPVPGRVKTRLCPPCTLAGAATIAEAALRDTFAAVERCRGVRRIVALDGAPGPWIPRGWTLVPQITGTFASRLTAAWDLAGGPGIQIGMDTPQVSSATLESTLDTLLTPGVDAVLGLAHDGGWWLLGLRQPHPHAFAGVPMSTAHTGRSQLRRLHSLGLRVELVDPCRDMDTFDDAMAIAGEAPATNTARAVHRMLEAAAS